MVVLAVAIFVSPGAAGAATVRLFRPSVDEDGFISVSDAGKHRNDLAVRFSGHAVLVVEHGRRALRARGGCRRRSPRFVICRAATPDNSVYVDAGGGKDVLRCRNGDISIDGGGGNDRLLAGTCASSLRGGSGNDVLVGGRYPDEIRGGGGRDRLYGSGGDDVLHGDGFWRHRGNDFIDGGPGRDTAAWDERGDGVHADLERGVAIGRRDRDRLRRIENLAGTTGNDVLAGNRRPNRLLGSYGRDLLIGRAGNDLLDGGIAAPGYQDIGDRRADRFSCGAGRDLIRFPERSALHVGCDRMTTGFGELFGETIRVRPRAVGAHSVAVPVICDDSLDTCSRRVVVRDGHRMLGRSRLVDDPPPAIRVRLSAAARRRGAVTIVVSGNDGYRFSWRLACRGAPRRDVCRIGGR
jgi:Ca2+-binding RTX toxin-like protein